MTMQKLIKNRKSVRTFDGRPLSDRDRQKLFEHVETVTNPRNIPVKYVLLDADTSLVR